MLERRISTAHRHHLHHRGIFDGLLGDTSSSSNGGHSSSSSGGHSSSSSGDSSSSSSTDKDSSSHSTSTSSDSKSSSTNTSSSTTKTSSSTSSSTPPPTSLSTDPNGGGVHTVTADPANSGNSSSSGDSSPLSTGAIAGIAAGGAVAIILLAVLIGCCVRRKAKNRSKPVVDPFNRHSFKHEGEMIPDPIETDYRRSPSPNPANMAGMGAASTGANNGTFLPPPSLPGLAPIPRVETPQMLQSRSPFDPYAQHRPHQQLHSHAPPPPPPPHMMNVGMVPPYKPPSPSYFPNYSDALIPPQPTHLDRSPSVQSHSAHISSPPVYSPHDEQAGSAVGAGAGSAVGTEPLLNPYDNRPGKGSDTTQATYRPASLRPGLQMPRTNSHNNNINDAPSGNSRLSTSPNLSDAYEGI